jgi:putative transposase
LLARGVIGCFNGIVEEALSMEVPFLLSKAQMRRIEPFFLLSHGILRVDDRRIVSGIVYVIKHGLMWRDAPKGYGPHKTIYNRFIRWSRLGMFNRIFAELAGKAGEPDAIMIERGASEGPPHGGQSPKKGLFPDISGAPRAG